MLSNVKCVQIVKMIKYMVDNWVGKADKKKEPRYEVDAWSLHRSVLDFSIPTTSNCNESYNSKFKHAVSGQKNKCNVWIVIQTIKVSVKC